MKISFRNSALALSVAFALGTAVPASAQDTSSGMRGNVQTPAGQTVANAQIEIVHEPSGTRSTATTNAQGQFVASGLRVGGPYTITVRSESGTQTYENVFLSLGDIYRLNAVVQAEQQQFERIAVSGSRLALDSSRTGPGTTYGADDIESMPMFNRDIKDIIRQNPLVVVGTDDAFSTSIAGTNPRFNSLTIDGMRQDDDFGLNVNGYPSARSPIPMEALSQISISSAPYSAKTGGFTGGGISAVTKSGTNEFEGSVFFDYASDSMAGRANPRGQDKVDLDEYTETTFGFGVGGPLINDRLFFFAAYEKWGSDFVSDGWGPQDNPNAANQVSVTQAELDRIRDITANTYNQEPGDWNTFPDEDDEKFLIKLDWNINQDHRASLTYQHTESFQVRPGRSNSGLLNLSSNGYGVTDTLAAMTANIYSNWTNNFSTDIRIGYKQVENRQAPLDGNEYGQVSVRAEGATVRFGPDPFRQANELDNDLFQARMNAEYLLGDHTLEFGFDYENLDIFNMFVPYSKGMWAFDSIDAYEAGDASSIRYENAITNDPRDGAAEFSYSTMAMYIQDRWMVNYDLTLDFGLRYERISSSDVPGLNDNFVERYGFENTATFDGIDIWLPRVGFNYALAENLNLRGGFGRFSGGRPNVWISNSYSNDGISKAESTLSRGAFSGVDIGSVPQELQNTIAAGDGRVDALDPNFKMPSEWKYSIGLDYLADLGMLGDDWFLTADYIYTSKEDEAFYRDLYRETQSSVVAPDGRRIYEVGEGRNDIFLTNADVSGRSHVAAFSAGKQWDDLSLSMGYAYQDVTDISGFGSSQAPSSYERYATFDRQRALIGRSDYETKHRFNFTLQYVREFFAGYESRFTLYGERRSGDPFSYTGFAGNSFGDDQPTDNRLGYLFYVPTGASDGAVRFDGWTYDDFAAVIADAGLSGYAGGVIPRNHGTSSYTNILDFKFEQQIPGFSENHRGSFFIEVNNLLNLIDSSQGRALGAGGPLSYQGLVDIDYDMEAEQYVYRPSTQNLGNPETFRPLQSTWRAKVGVRYRF